MMGKELRDAVRYLKRGGLVIYPTETAYGIGAAATSRRAVRAVFKIKGRSGRKPLPLIVSSKRQAERLARFNSLAKCFARRFWPGPLTMVLPVRARAAFAPGVVSKGAVAVRVSSHPTARALSRALGCPLISTSANLSGRSVCYSVRAVRKQLGRRMEEMLVLDEGTLPRREPSTIVRVIGNHVEVLRRGTVRI